MTDENNDNLWMTVAQAEQSACGAVQERTIRLAASRGDRPGARKIGRDWIIPSDGLSYYLSHRPKRGPAKKAIA
jgi:hypothetical protein